MKNLLPPVLGVSLALAALSAGASAQVLYVDADAPGDPGPNNNALSDPLEDGSPAHPYDRIQKAITAAAAGTEIRVLAGTYVDLGTISLEGKELWLHGVDGPEATVVDATTLGDQVMEAISGETAATIIEGLTLRGGQATSSSPNDRGAGLYVNLSSVTVRDCIFDGNNATYGGAVYMNGSTECLFEDCLFSGGEAYRGGAAYLNLATASFSRCSFIDNNSTNSGGAFFAGSSNLTIQLSLFQDNTSSGHGGAALVSGGTMTIADSVATGNTAPLYGGVLYGSNDCEVLVTGSHFAENQGQYGGAIMLYTTSGDVEDCTFDANVSTLAGSAIYKNDSATLGVRRCRFTDNNDQGGYGTVAVRAGSSSSTDRIQDCVFNGNFGTVAGVGALTSHKVEVYSCTLAWNQGVAVRGYNSQFRVVGSILWGNSSETLGPIEIEYSDVLGGYSGTGNINTDPLFADAFGEDGIAGSPDDDFRLTEHSPCIDAGDTRVAVDDALPHPVDLAGKPRVIDRPFIADKGRALIGLTIDMGPYENHDLKRFKLKKVQ